MPTYSRYESTRTVEETAFSGGRTEVSMAGPDRVYHHRVDPRGDEERVEYVCGHLMNCGVACECERERDAKGAHAYGGAGKEVRERRLLASRAVETCVRAQRASVAFRTARPHRHTHTHLAAFGDGAANDGGGRRGEVELLCGIAEAKSRLVLAAVTSNVVA